MLNIHVGREAYSGSSREGSDLGISFGPGHRLGCGLGHLVEGLAVAWGLRGW